MTELMLNSYEKLAEILNKIPNGYVKTDDGTHLRVLQWIFTPDEAELASKMKLMGETVDELASRLDLPIKGLVGKLETMVTKGQIHAWDSSTGRRYALIPFIVGIYEEQLNRMDSKFAQLVEEYLQKQHAGGLFDTEPPIFRVIPVNRAIKPELSIYPFEEAEQILKQAKSWGVRECVCKKQQALLDKPCKYPTSVCLIFASKENAFENSKLTRATTKEQALDLLCQAEEAGLVHCSMNVQTGHNYICNCCTCCCAVVKGLTERGQPLAFVHS
ncbi:unnamed protein product, partial [marine sediment metagenome]